MKFHLPSPPQDFRTLVLNVLIAALALLVAFLGYSLIDRHLFHRPMETARAGEPASSIIQIELLNGCGSAGVATTFRDYLRARGYDVVEMRNYRSFDVEQTLVVDRAGFSANAEKVAYALGVKRTQIVQQLNPDYFVDVSVVIGKDFSILKPSQ